MNKLLLLGLISILAIALFTSHSTFAKSSKDKKAEKSIDKAIGKAVEGKYSNIDMVNISKFNDSTSVTVYNKTGGSVSPSPPPVPPPTPNPPPVSNGFKLCMVGDFKDSKVFDAMKKGGCNFRVALGDMGYGSDLKLVKSIAPDRAICGNHDSKEDSTPAMEAECLAYAGESWWVKVQPNTMVMGFDTNGNIQRQLDAAEKIINSPTMDGVKNLIFLSHKGGFVPPNSHHPAEGKSLYVGLFTILDGKQVNSYAVFGHNHVSAAADTNHWYEAGAGGKSFYTCGIDSTWTFCDNTHVAYLQFTIDNAGIITPNFIDTSGKVIH